MGRSLEGAALVSIHAPTRGATIFDIGIQFNLVSFNPRAHAGRDPASAMPSSWICRFQSTRPRGARPQRRDAQRLRNPRFNPRAHAGRDLAVSALSLSWSSFNPRAHAGRDTYRFKVMLVGTGVSIHAPTRGAT